MHISYIADAWNSARPLFFGVQVCSERTHRLTHTVAYYPLIDCVYFEGSQSITDTTLVHAFQRFDVTRVVSTQRCLIKEDQLFVSRIDNHKPVVSSWCDRDRFCSRVPCMPSESQRLSVPLCTTQGCAHSTLCCRCRGSRFGMPLTPNERLRAQPHASMTVL